MSRLGRRVALATLLLLVLHAVGVVAIQRVSFSSFRSGLMAQVYRGLERPGLLADCAARPGPWTGPTAGLWSAWPVAPDGRLVGADAPVARVSLPPPGNAATQVVGGVAVDVYASRAPGCGGVAHALQHTGPAMEGRSGTVAFLVAARLTLALAVVVALVGLTAVPLVRRIRALSSSMEGIVEAGFEGEVGDLGPDEIGDVARAHA